MYLQANVVASYYFSVTAADSPKLVPNIPYTSEVKIYSHHKQLYELTTTNCTLRASTRARIITVGTMGRMNDIEICR